MNIQVGCPQNKLKKIWFKPKIAEIGSVSRLFRFIFETNENFVCLFLYVSVFLVYFEATKQTDLFQNEPKQTEIGLKNINSTQKRSLFAKKILPHFGSIRP